MKLCTIHRDNLHSQDGRTEIYAAFAATEPEALSLLREDGWEQLTLGDDTWVKPPYRCGLAPMLRLGLHPQTGEVVAARYYHEERPSGSAAGIRITE